MYPHFVNFLNPNTQVDASLPAGVGAYHSLAPLDAAGASTPSALGIPSRVFHAVSGDTGVPVALRRLDPRHLAPTPDLLTRYVTALGRWRALGGHPFLARWIDTFVSAELDGVPALWLAHEFVPGAISAEDTWLRGDRAAGLREDALWPLFAQLAAALRAVHGSGLLLWGTGLSPSKILVRGHGGVAPGTRATLSCPGSVDPLMEHLCTGEESVARLRRADLGALGQTMLCVVCCGAKRPPTIEALVATVSPALARCIAGLLGSPSGM